MIESFNSILLAMHKRVTNPILGNFILGWCLWNWKIVIFLVWGNSAENRIAIIEGFEPFLINCRYIDLLLIPLLYSLFAVFCFPWITQKYYGYYVSQKIELANIKRKSEGEELLSKSESEAFRLRMYVEKNKIAEQFVGKEEEIKLLDSQLKAQLETIIKLEKETESTKYKLDNSDSARQDLEDECEKLRIENKEIKKQLHDYEAREKEKNKRHISEDQAEQIILKKFIADYTSMNFTQKDIIEKILYSDNNEINIKRRTSVYGEALGLVKMGYLLTALEANLSVDFKLRDSILKYLTER